MLLILGGLVALVNLVPIDSRFKTAIYIIVGIGAILFLLQMFGLFDMGSVNHTLKH